MPQVSAPSVRSTVLNVLTRDTVVLLFYAVIVTEALLYSLPLMSRSTLTMLGASPFEIPFVATAALAGFYGVRRIQDRAERQFWVYLSYACVFWVATLAAIAVVPATRWRVVDDVWADAAYLFFYSPILFAAECKPHISQLGASREVECRLRWAGVTLLVVGWFAYFVVAPVALDPAHFGANIASALLFVTLDAAIVIRFAWRAYSCGSVRWRVLYGTLALTGVALFMTDSLDLLKGVDLFALADGAITDLLWALPPFFLLMAFRLRGANLSQVVDPATRERVTSSGMDPVRVGGFLVGSALSFPVVHFVLHTWHEFSPALVQVHRYIVLAEMALLGTLAVLASYYLEHQRVAAERRRASREERVRQARTLEAVSHLASVVADEYSGSLKAIGAFVDRAIDTLGPGDALRDEAVRAAERMQRAVDFTGNLQAISRQQRGHPARVDVSAAVSDRMPELRHLLGTSILLENVPTREPCLTVIDPAHLRIVLLDLVINARDAMPHGGRCRIETGISAIDADTASGMAIQPGRYAMLSVRDSGSGIPKDILPHVFEPFVSSKPGEDGRTGLGLATLYALVSQYGGCVSVTSEPGDTAFEILLPSPR